MILKKLIRNISDYGPTVTLKKSFGFIFSPFFEKKILTVYQKKLNNADDSYSTKSRYNFIFINENDYEYIQQIQEMEEWLRGNLKKKLQNKSLCLVALDNDIVAGFNLISFGQIEIPLIKMQKELNPHDAWSEQITVGKNYRKKGIAKELRYNIFSELKRRCYQTLYGGALKTNIASLRLADKVGFETVTDIVYKKTFNKKSWCYTNRWE